MILEIDAGNTFVKWRLLNHLDVVKRGRFLTEQLSRSIPVEWQAPVTEIRVASVAGKDVNQQIGSVLSGYHAIEIQFAQTTYVCAGVKNSYAQPERMGVDRWLAMLAAYNNVKRACCVVDCGSAITIDFIDAAGEHQGGYILPGLRLMKQGLLSNTAEIQVDRSMSSFDLEPGRDTSAAVDHGINYLFLSLVEKVARDINTPMESYQLFVTGGDGQLFASLVEGAEYFSDLVLDGLAWSLSP